MRHLLAFLALALFCGLPAEAKEITVTAAPVPLDPTDANRSRLGPFAFVNGLVLSSEDPDFGGWSALIWSPDGRLVAMISDEGQVLQAELTVDAEGRLRGLEAVEMDALKGLDGAPLADKAERDAEAAALVPGTGFAIIAFERRHRLWIYSNQTATPVAFDPPPALASLPAQRANNGMEALAALPGDRLIGFLEGAPEDAETPGFLWQDGQWQDLSYVLSDGFQVTDATFLPHSEGEDGDLLVLERFYTPEVGPKMRLRRIPGEAIRPGARLEGELWGELALPATVDNFEAMATRRDQDGMVQLLLLSDDNFNPSQRTLLLLFTLVHE